MEEGLAVEAAPAAGAVVPENGSNNNFVKGYKNLWS